MSIAKEKNRLVNDFHLTYSKKALKLNASLREIVIRCAPT